MNGTKPAAAQPRIFRGWLVLAGIFLTMTTGSGFAFYAQGVFLDALVAEQGFSVGMAGAGTGTFFVVSGIAGYFAGGLISRFDIRAVMVVGATIASVGILLLGQIRTEWQMFAVFIIYGGGYAFAGLVPATSLVTRWFHVRRSIALSIASTGLSVGGIAITPFIAQVIDDRSLVDLAPQLAIAYWLGMVPITLLLLRPSPESLGLRPDGQTALKKGQTASAPVGVPFAEAVKTRYFRFVSAGFILVMGAQVGAIQHVFKLTKDTVDLDAARLALVVVTSTSVAARLLGGLAATRFRLGFLTSALIVVQAIGISIIGLAEQRLTILIGVFILGAAMGNLLMLHPLLLADAFGIRDYPRIYGLGSLLMVTGVGLGPLVVGIIRDASNYRTAYLTMSVVALVGLAIFRGAGAVPTASSAPVALAVDDQPDGGVTAALASESRAPEASEPFAMADLQADSLADERHALVTANAGAVELDDGVTVVPLAENPARSSQARSGRNGSGASGNNIEPAGSNQPEKIESASLALADRPAPNPSVAPTAPTAATAAPVPTAPVSPASSVRPVGLDTFRPRSGGNTSGAKTADDETSGPKKKVAAAVSAGLGLAMLGWLLRRARTGES